MKPDSGNLAVWAVTPGGMELALKLAAAFPGTALHLSRNLPACPDTCYIFNRLKDSVQERFSLFQGHVFIMSTGIVVRVISPCIRSKMLDPAVVVMDEEGQYAISLLSGHVGGANRLASEIARKLHVTPVITTATDIRQIPSIDVIAVDHGLLIENPAAIKSQEEEIEDEKEDVEIEDDEREDVDIEEVEEENKFKHMYINEDNMYI